MKLPGKMMVIFHICCMIVLQRKVAFFILVLDAVGLHPARSATAREREAARLCAVIIEIGNYGHAQFTLEHIMFVRFPRAFASHCDGFAEAGIFI